MMSPLSPHTPKCSPWDVNYYDYQCSRTEEEEEEQSPSRLSPLSLVSLNFPTDFMLHVLCLNLSFLRGGKIIPNPGDISGVYIVTQSQFLIRSRMKEYGSKRHVGFLLLLSVVVILWAPIKVRTSMVLIWTHRIHLLWSIITFLRSLIVIR